MSIALVLAAHAFQHGGPRALAAYLPGALGVLIFFVISGFLITSLLVEDIDRGVASLPRFYARRLVRLAPAQLVFLAGLFLLTRLTPLQMSGCQFATALTYTKNYGCSGWVDGHLWSLSVEEQFYLIWPAALIFLPRKWAVGLAVALAAGAPISRAVEYMGGHRQFFWLTSNVDALMYGCLAALFVRRPMIQRIVRWRPGIGRALAVAVIFVPVWLSAHLAFGAANVLFGPALQAAGATYLILSLTLVRAGWSYAVLNTRPMAVIGVLSYSIYLWQQPFFAERGAFGPGLDWLLRFPFDLTGALLAGAASYILVERPFLGFRRRLHQIGRAAADA